MDNCKVQNKNRTIYSGMVAATNRGGGPDEIIFPYFEKEHTYRSADSFHHQVEKADGTEECQTVQ